MPRRSLDDVRPAASATGFYAMPVRLDQLLRRLFKAVQYPVQTTNKETRVIVAGFSVLTIAGVDCHSIEVLPVGLEPGLA
jgi:hypothetical protein